MTDEELRKSVNEMLEKQMRLLSELSEAGEFTETMQLPEVSTAMANLANAMRL